MPASVATSTSTEPESAEVLVPVVMVEQQALTEVPSGFDPSGQVWLDSYCSGWRVDGAYLGSIPEDECQRWMKGEVRLSYDKERSATVDGASVHLKGPGVTGSLSCSGCANVRDVAWSPEGDRVALVRDAGRVEVWSVEEARKLSELAFTPPNAEDDVRLAWSDEIYVLVKGPDPREVCDYEDEDADEDADCIDEDDMIAGPGDPMTFRLVEFADVDAPAVERDVGPTHILYDYVTDVSLDPWGRCLLIAEYSNVGRGDVESQITSQDLSGECTLEMTLETDFDNLWALESSEWVDGPHSRFMSVMASVDDEYEGSLETTYYTVEISDFEGSTPETWIADFEPVEPPLPATDNAWIELTERDLLAAQVVGDDIEAVWRHCFDLETNAHAGGNDREWCTLTADLPRRCEFLELAPDGVTTLAQCGRGEGTLTLLGDERVDLGISSDAEWVWGDGWLVTIDDPSGVVLHRLSAPKTPTPLGPASAWVPATLGPAQDRVVLHDEQGLHLIDARSGSEVDRVPSDLAHPLHVALCASGKRLAVTDGTQIETIDLLGDRKVETWQATDAAVIAWRQDERVIFTGPNETGPTQAWDASEGVPRPEALPALEGGELDPSWRWVMLTPNRVRRTVDGLEIWFDDSGVLLDDGRFEGEPEALDGVLYRVGDDPLRDRLLTPQEARSLMERQGLTADFFSGRPIASGPVMAPRR